MRDPYAGITSYLPSVRRRPVKSPNYDLLVFLAVHLPLAMILKSSVALATAHALCTFAVGLVLATGARTPERLLYVLGYIVASEPLWRVSKAMVFYEFGKYALAALSILGLIRFRLWPRADKSVLVFFLLLLPSLMVLPRFDRQAISFNLSGPFSLAMATLFLSALEIRPRVLGRILLVTIAPILALAFVATFMTMTTESINFYTSKIAAGGVGKNQASSILSLGGVLAFFYLFIEPRGRSMRFLVGAAGVWCMAQGVLTFSRGGIATALGAVAVAGFFLLRDRRSRGAFVLRSALIAVVAAYMIVPVIDSVTGGAFRDRFADTNLTGRDKLIKADLAAFVEHPILGVGPGEAAQYHSSFFRAQTSAHTEYSRLLAEHGSLGLMAMLLLFWMTLKRLLRPAPLRGKAIAVGLTVWCLLFMFHAAMRMAAAPFAFALASARLLSDDPARATPRRLRQRLPGQLTGQLTGQLEHKQPRALPGRSSRVPTRPY